jgi:hypothetical protein
MQDFDQGELTQHRTKSSVGSAASCPTERLTGYQPGAQLAVTASFGVAYAVVWALTACGGH